MIDTYIPLPPHAFDPNPQAPEECRKCGDSFASHPHDYTTRHNGIYSDGCCAICGEPESHQLHEQEN